MGITTLEELLRDTVIQNGDKPAVGFVGDEVLTYSEFGKKVKALSAFLEDQKLVKGDKVALWATNSPNWGITYFAIVSMGLVVVPILPDFHPNEVENIIQHSSSKALFVSENLLDKVPISVLKAMDFSVLVDSFGRIESNSGVAEVSKERVIDSFSSPLNQPKVVKGDLASIIYTSGTTGKSKGVMLTHWNLVFTVLGALKLHHVKVTDRLLSLLPLSHTLENTVGFLLPIKAGASIYYLRKLPTPAVLLPALKKVKPTIILAVPLIIEKIYKGKILPGINSKKITKALYRIKPGRVLLNRVAGKKLLETFGGELEFFGIGGAKLDASVEKFLREAKFPYAIGYGLTETSPLLAGFDVYKGKYQSTGNTIEGVTLKINDADPVTGEGEIWAFGDNVMQGYYKEPELTAEVLTDDGWFKTGDLGCIDEDGFVFIKGRLKNMIVGASGENIYPEEIEAVINEFDHVLESIVVQQKGRLVAMVHFNYEELEKKFEHVKEKASGYIDEHIDNLRKELKDFVNARVNRFSRVQMVIASSKPFEKTATKKIKRFLYH